MYESIIAVQETPPFSEEEKVYYEVYCSEGLLKVYSYTQTPGLRGYAKGARQKTVIKPVNSTKKTQWYSF